MKTASNRRATTIFALAFSALILLGSCVAEPAHAQTADDMKTCDAVALAARVTMVARQEGVALEKQVDIALASGNPGFVKMTIHAYETPILKGAQARRAAGYQFEQLYWTECVKYMVRK